MYKIWIQYTNLFKRYRMETSFQLLYRKEIADIVEEMIERDREEEEQEWKWKKQKN